MLPKNLSKVTAGTESAVICNLRDCVARVYQSLARFPKPIACHVLHRGHVQVLLEKAKADSLAYMCFLCNIFHADCILIVRMNETHHGFHLLVGCIDLGI